MKYTRQYVEQRSKFGMFYEDFNDEWWLCKVLGRIPMYVRKDDKSVAPCLVNEGFWEAWITAWALNNVDENTLFVDVGANTGYYSFIAADRGAKVVAFEPQPNYAKMMKASADLNNFDIQIFKYALSDKVDTVELTVPNEFQGSASIRGYLDTEKYPSGTMMVKTMPLDDVDQLRHKTDRNMIIKID